MKAKHTLMGVFEEKHRDLVTFASKLNSQEPEDAVQEAVLYALEHGYDKKYDADASQDPVTYARALVFWQVRNQQVRAQTEQRAKSVVFEASDDSYTLDSLEVAIDVDKALNNLPIVERAVAVDVLIFGRTVRETARQFNKSPTWAEQILQEAKRKLAKELEIYKGVQNTPLNPI